MKAVRGGLLAGFIATVAVSMMMMIKTATGQFPELHVVRTLSGIIGTADNLVAGFAAHIFIGTVVWGIVYAMIEPRIPIASPTVKGALFGILAWLLMMLVFMPLAGAGLFAVHRGTMTVPLITLAYHLVFGVVLGNVYGWNAPAPRRAPSRNVKTRA
jgi:uncharacterized membrane protein YagU involved in acid resistance